MIFHVFHVFKQQKLLKIRNLLSFHPFDPVENSQTIEFTFPLKDADFTKIMGRTGLTIVILDGNKIPGFYKNCSVQQVDAKENTVVVTISADAPKIKCIKGTLTDRIRKTILYSEAPLGRQEICEELPDIDKSAISGAVSSLAKRGIIQKIRGEKGMKYWKVD